MLRKCLGICAVVCFTILLANAGDVSPTDANLTAAAIVDKNVAARGGLQAWRSVQTMAMEGKLGAGGNQRPTIPVPVPDQKGLSKALPSRPTQEVQLPFLMELKRTRKLRLEVQFNGQTAIQVYDGTNGWKLRPFLNRRVVEPYSSEEVKGAALLSDLDGPLVDYAAKGTQLELVGVEKVENRDAYNLKLTMKNGQSLHVWIDARTFLEAKIEGQPRRLDGVFHPVEIYYRDYRAVSGLEVPFTMETKVLPIPKSGKAPLSAAVSTEKIVVEKVMVNPKLEESLFTRPELTPAPKGK
jgi:hypothetical protein